MTKKRKLIERAVAKKELERIDAVLVGPHLLIGGLAVQQYYSARISHDIDLVCDFEVAQTILRKLYPSKDWKVEDSKNDDYRPSCRIRHKVDDIGTIIFGPKISEREPYRHLDWGALVVGARPFKGTNQDLDHVLVPPPHALAYAKMISFLCRQSPDDKVATDLQDFCDLTNHEEFSVTLFYDLLRRSRASDELISTFRKKAGNYAELAEASCLHSLSELYYPATPGSQTIFPSGTLSIYLAAPHKNLAKNNKLKSLLTGPGIAVAVPYEEVVSNGGKDSHSDVTYIRSICMAAIDRSDLLLVDLDTYGLDTAWEIGYAEGARKKVVGYNEDVFLTTDERQINRRLYRENFMHGWSLQHVYTDVDPVCQAISGKRVYMCGPLSDTPIDDKTRRAIAASAAATVYPKDHLARQQDLPRDYPLADRSETNRLLQECDVLLVSLPRYGMDSSWQIGYATALGKEIVGWIRQDDGRELARQSFWDHWMHGWKSKPHVVGVTDLLALLKGIAIQKKEADG